MTYPPLTMSLLRFFGKNIFLLLFFFFAFGYCYSLVKDLVAYQYFLKPFMVSSLLIQYVLVSKEKNSFFIAALFFALLGDLFFNVETPSFFVYAMGCFLIFNSFMMILVAESAGEIRISNLFLYTAPFFLILFIAINFLTKNVGSILVLMTVYGIMLMLLCALCLYFLVKTKSKTAIFFFLGSLSSTLASFTKVLKDYFGITIFLLVVTSLSYIFSLFFYYKAMLNEEKIVKV